MAIYSGKGLGLAQISEMRRAGFPEERIAQEERRMRALRSGVPLALPAPRAIRRAEKSAGWKGLVAEARAKGLLAEMSDDEIDRLSDQILRKMLDLADKLDNDDGEEPDEPEATSYSPEQYLALCTLRAAGVRVTPAQRPHGAFDASAFLSDHENAALRARK